MDKEDFKNAAGDEIKETMKENANLNIPVYDSYKGKQMQGSKSWKMTRKEEITIKVLAAVFAAMVFLAFLMFFLLVSPGLKILFFILAIFSGIGGMGGYLFYVAFRHNKEDPMEMHYYDVDYKQNYLTREGYDNTKEISKEEFYNTADKNE